MDTAQRTLSPSNNRSYVNTREERSVTEPEKTTPANNSSQKPQTAARKDDGLICKVSTDMTPAQVNDSLMRFLRRKFPQPDCNGCMSRTMGTELKTRTVEKYDPIAQNAYYVDEDYTEATITVRNKCNKNVRVLGISKGNQNGNSREYGLVWVIYSANEKQSFSRASDDMVGSVLGNMLVSSMFGGGEARDIDLSHIGKPYDDANADVGSIQYVRIIEENSSAQTKISGIGVKSIEVNSYAKTTNITVKKGDKIYLRATGRVVTGAWSGGAGPNGKEYSNIWNIVPDFNYGALILKIGNGEWMLAGEENCITAPTTGKLSFAINDTDPSDNSGSFIVEYSINKPLQ